MSGERLAIAMTCFPTVGGSGVIASTLADGLAARGHRVHLIATALPGRLELARSSVTFHEVSVPTYPVFDHPPSGLALASKLLEVARSERIELIHAHYALPHAVNAVLTRELLGKNGPAVVTSLHGSDVTRLGASAAYTPLIRSTVEHSDAVTAPSHYLKDAAYLTLGLSADTRIDVVPNFVDTERFAPAATVDRRSLHALFERAMPADAPVLIHVSNFRAVKRVTDVIEVFARIRREQPARLVLVGDGPDRGAAEARTRALGVQDDVKFLGNQRDVVERLRHADAFILPSETESFGVAALESMSAAVPVFAYRVGGLSEVVVAGTGVLVEPLNVDALATAVREGLADREQLRRMGLAARQHVVTHFRLAPALDQVEALYWRTLQKRSSP